MNKQFMNDFFSKSKKYLQGILLTAFFLMVNGCATTLNLGMMASANGAPQVEKTDEIIALGKLNQSDSQKLGYENVVALVGNESTYLFFEGGEDVLKIFSILDTSRIKFSDNSKLFVKDQGVWGLASFVYLKEVSGGDYTDEDKVNLAKLNFVTSKTNGEFEKAVDIKALFSKSTSVDAIRESNLNIKMRVWFYGGDNPPVAIKRLKNILLLPFTVAIDGLTWPLQLMFPAHTICIFTGQHEMIGGKPQPKGCSVL